MAQPPTSTFPDDLFDDVDPDLEVPCPLCGGTIALFLRRVGEDAQQCSIRGVVHREPDR